MILIGTDSDGVLKDNKRPVAPELIEIITRARMHHDVVVVRITGAPYHHLMDGLHVDRAFGESGGVELLVDGSFRVSDHAYEAREALDLLKQSLDIAVQDGCVNTVHGMCGIEGVRHTTLTMFFGAHPLYPHVSTSADPNAVAAWVQDAIDRHRLPFYMTRGKGHTFEFFDIGHAEIMKKERIMEMILADGMYERVYYLGDSHNDAGAMRVRNVIPVTFSNGTQEIKEIVRERNGMLIEKPGPDGGSIEFFRRLINGEL